MQLTARCSRSGHIDTVRGVGCGIGKTVPELFARFDNHDIGINIRAGEMPGGGGAAEASTEDDDPGPGWRQSVQEAAAAATRGL
jgi:hypothetical protein